MVPEFTMSMYANKDDLIADMRREIDALRLLVADETGRWQDLWKIERAENDRLRRALQQFADNKLSDENCASVEVASRRIRGLARAALAKAE